jgi:hypothetical protein
MRDEAGERFPGGIRLRTLLIILTVFWAYVTVSNVLYAHSMQLSIASFSEKQLFARWNVRVLQHAILYPVFLICVWLSLRIGWRRLRNIGAQIAVALVFAFIPFIAMNIAEHALATQQEMTDKTLTMMLWADHDASDFAIWFASATSFFLTYGFGIALATGFKVYQNFRDSELRLSAMERAWSSARLSALRMQLSPHTLFNLLNTIRDHISWEPATAQSMVVQLSDLLRQLLNAGETEFTRLVDEIKFVRTYLELQQRRFIDRLTLELPDVQSMPTTWVPSLILQPLVENAVVHGLAGASPAVVVRISVAVDGATLVMKVVNSYVPLEESYRHGGNGIGLRNVAERLAMHFQDKATLTAGPHGTHDWCAEIRMPLLGEGPVGSRG